MRLLNNVLMINGTALPAPDALDISRNKIWSSNAGRTAAGLMVGDIVARKYKLEAEWKPLRAETAQMILNAVDTDAFFYCTFIDPYTNAEHTIEIYGGDVSISVKRYYKDNVWYANLKISLIER